MYWRRIKMAIKAPNPEWLLSARPRYLSYLSACVLYVKQWISSDVHLLILTGVWICFCFQNQFKKTQNLAFWYQYLEASPPTSVITALSLMCGSKSTYAANFLNTFDKCVWITRCPRPAPVKLSRQKTTWSLEFRFLKSLVKFLYFCPYFFSLHVFQK